MLLLGLCARNFRVCGLGLDLCKQPTLHSHILLHFISHHITSLHFTDNAQWGGGGLFIHTICVHQHVYNNYITQLTVNTLQLSNKFSCKSIEDILSLTSLFFQKTSLVAFLVFLPYNHATKELLWRKMCKITKPHQKH